ncbi:MAG TPA: FAD-dependent oxidoreductase [candidate division Zixibacteria bacterium]|nr:FAD-dependent oxidoreductase [candidate division Zixibacteria bacterium]
MVTVTNFYGTEWCRDCKRSKAFLREHRIAYNWIDIDKNEEAALVVEKINDGKRRAPTIEFSDGTHLSVPTNVELAEKLNLVSEDVHELHDVIIIGGGPAGLTCALYTSREGFNTLLIEKGALGGQVGFTEKLDNFPGFPDGITGEELAERMARQVAKFGVDFLKATEILKIRRERECLYALTTNGKEYKTKAMVIATGSKYRMLNIPGEIDLIGYKIHFCATCDAPFYRDLEVIVIGGGNSAFEESLFIARFAKKVTIVGRSDNWKASKILQDKIKEIPNIELLGNKETKEFLIGKSKTLTGVVFRDTKTKEEVTLHPDGVFIFIGMTPNSEIVEGLVEFDPGKFIKTGYNMMTKTPGLFAAGDCRSGSTQQAASAAGEGATVALMVREYLKSL